MIFNGMKWLGIKKKHTNRGTAHSKNRKTRSAASSNLSSERTSKRNSSKNVWLGTTSGLEFETVCANILSGCGFRVKQLGGVADGGRDLIVWQNNGKKMVVECKHQSKLIGRPVIQKLHSAFIAEKADAGIIISTSGFSGEAEEYEYSKPKTSNVLDAISRVHGKIVLVDLAGLRELAGIAGIKMHETDDPSTRDIDHEQVLRVFDGIKSHPTNLRDIAGMSMEGHRTDTYWVADVSVKQTFRNTANKITHRMNKNKTYACGPDGTVLGGKLAKFVLKGGDDKPRARGTFQRNGVVGEAKKAFTTKARYKGGNGAHYTMTCIPSTDKIKILTRPVGVQSTIVSVRLLRTTYRRSIPDWDGKLNCRLCGKPKSIMNSLLLCNQCGRMAHAKSCGGECKDCKKTLCNKCAHIQKGFLKTSRFCDEHANQ